MKRIWCAAFFMIIIAALCFYEFRLVTDAAQNLENSINKVSAYAKAGDTAAAVEQLTAAESEWERREKIINCLLPHNLTDDISKKLCILPAVIESGGAADAAVTLRQLKLALHSLKSNETASLENFL